MRLVINSFEKKFSSEMKYIDFTCCAASLAVRKNLFCMCCGLKTEKKMLLFLLLTVVENRQERKVAFCTHFWDQFFKKNIQK